MAFLSIICYLLALVDEKTIRANGTSDKSSPRFYSGSGSVQFPDAVGVVQGRGNEPGAIWRKSDRRHGIMMSFEFFPQGSGFCIPYVDDAIGARRGQ
jgi:hypothetical protein